MYLCRRRCCTRLGARGISTCMSKQSSIRLVLIVVLRVAGGDESSSQNCGLETSVFHWATEECRMCRWLPPMFVEANVLQSGWATRNQHLQMRVLLLNTGFKIVKVPSCTEPLQAHNGCTDGMLGSIIKCNPSLLDLKARWHAPEPVRPSCSLLLDGNYKLLVDLSDGWCSLSRMKIIFYMFWTT